MRITRRGGAAGILNSRAEFNRCCIPRLVIEGEDEEQKKSRREQNQEELDKTKKSLELEDISWEERKKRERELAEVKIKCNDEETNGWKKKRLKTMKYELLDGNWGKEEEEEGEEIQEPPTTPGSKTPMWRSVKDTKMPDFFMVVATPLSGL